MHSIPNSHVCAKDLAPVDSKTETAQGACSGLGRWSQLGSWVLMLGEDPHLWAQGPRRVPIFDELVTKNSPNLTEVIYLQT